LKLCGLRKVLVPPEKSRTLRGFRIEAGETVLPDVNAVNLVLDNRSEIPHHHERRLLERLRDAGWVKASKILATPSFIEKLVAKGWIERSIVDGHLCYRITDQGLAAKEMPI
jgi:hypothetical protein